MSVLEACLGAHLRMKCHRQGVYRDLKPFDTKDCERCPHAGGELPDEAFCQQLNKGHTLKCRCSYVISGAPND